METASEDLLIRAVVVLEGPTLDLGARAIQNHRHETINTHMMSWRLTGTKATQQRQGKTMCANRTRWILAETQGLQEGPRRKTLGSMTSPLALCHLDHATPVLQVLHRPRPAYRASSVSLSRRLRSPRQQPPNPKSRKSSMPPPRKTYRSGISTMTGSRPGQHLRSQRQQDSGWTSGTRRPVAPRWPLIECARSRR